ncbi:fatty acid desaturase family protein [Brevundimonas sp. SORGH_AS_0993]|uniref:fatty acid desaturase family protein n=1 Tax=Brevundimonas sp. SORGH_AS_0993 TaxID=3041794 RepID=UPI00277FF7B5|nr:fatty acid desaturase family protein [Brevundimonas sp. SORGH_AS_0993]MDQ1154332.1 fatty acid desaturase [Brevundimonas sp. SORGH_AS_0993]
MPAAPRIAPSILFTPQEWAPFQTRSAWVGPLLVLHCWAVIGLAVTAGVMAPWLIPICVMVVGTRQLGLAILMHEAAHGGLSRNARLNDFLGHWLCAVPIGASLKDYRPYHLRHHRFVQQPEDPDRMLSAPFPVTPASLRRKLIRDLTGQTFFKQRVLLPLAQIRAAPSSSDSAKGLRSSSPTSDSAKGMHEAAHDYESIVIGRSVLPFLAFNAVLLAGFIAAGVWWAFFALWLLPMATWFPMVTRLRNIAEHACVEGGGTNAFRAARTTRARWWERAFIAPYWVNFHAEHHLFMHVPCWKLPALHRAVRARPQGRAVEVAPGYLDVLRSVTTRPAP